MTTGDRHNNSPAAMTMGVAHSGIDSAGPFTSSSDPGPSDLVQDQQQQALWRKEVLDLLKQLVVVQKEVAQGQVQVVQLLGMLGTQVSPVQFRW